MASAARDNTGKTLNMRGTDDLRITGKPGDARLTYTIHNHKRLNWWLARKRTG
jgi:hypothetical protein